MARKKKQTDLGISEVEETTPDISVEAEETTVPSDGMIASKEEAIEEVRKYNVPEHIKTVFVTADRNVFYRNNPAKVHASQKNIKLFAIKWD